MIPVNTPILGPKEKELLNECLETGWISSEGPFIKQFECEFAKYIGRDFGIAVSSGSAALDIAFQALDIHEGDEVIMPTFTIISPAFSIIRQGGIPVLVDSDPTTWNMDVRRVEEKITPRTKAICIVHIYGLPVDMDPLIQLAKDYNLKILEDAAEVIGQTYQDRKCGTFGDLSVFSFYPNKHVTTGEGGMILTDQPELFEKCAKFRNLSFEPKGRRFIHEQFGWNYRMTNLQAALGIGQLARITETVQRKRAIGQKYNELLSDLARFQLPLAKTSYANNIYWVYGLVANDEELSLSTQAYLSANKIGTRPFFWCMHEQPVFRKLGLFKDEKYPVAEKIARNGFYVPSGVGLTDSDIEKVSHTILQAAS